MMEPNPKELYLQKWEDCECKLEEIVQFVKSIASDDSPLNLENIKNEAKRLIGNKPNFPSETSPKRFYRCENCNKMVDIDGETTVHEGCDFVWGRRGWRQLGAYDG